MLREAATDPDAALGEHQDGAGPRPHRGERRGENIPGAAKPTTSQLAGDPGLVGAERAYQNQNSVEHSRSYGTRSETAQTKTMQGVQQGGDSTKVADLITQRLQQIDQNHEARSRWPSEMHETGQQAREQGVAQAEAAARQRDGSGRASGRARGSRREG